MAKPNPFRVTLKAYKLNIDTGKYFIAYISKDSPDCRLLDFRTESRVRISAKTKSILCTLRILDDPLITPEKIGLSESAWEKLGIRENENLEISLSEALESFQCVIKKSYGKPYTQSVLDTVMSDISQGRFSEAQLAAFFTASTRLTQNETIFLTKAMARAGNVLKWKQAPIVDKHCIGGVPGNRTTMIVVPLLAAFGLTIPKTSSRAITSPSGTADTMGVLAPVDLTVSHMKKVVEREGGCIISGQSVGFSPSDGYMIQVIKTLGLDADFHLAPSILSKKLAAGSTHVLIDIPIGKMAKVKSLKEAESLSALFHRIAKSVGLTLEIVKTDGTQPIGYGVGPALEARDVLSVLRCEANAPRDLRDKSLLLARYILEAWGNVPRGKGLALATDILEKGDALRKFEAICEAQGGMHEPTFARHTHTVLSPFKGSVKAIEIEGIIRLAKLSGAPAVQTAGLELYVKKGSFVDKKDPLFTLYADSKEALNYALCYFSHHPHMIRIEP